MAMNTGQLASFDIVKDALLRQYAISPSCTAPAAPTLVAQTQSSVDGRTFAVQTWRGGEEAVKRVERRITVATAFCSGLICATMSLPFDFAKTCQDMTKTCPESGKSVSAFAKLCPKSGVMKSPSVSSILFNQARTHGVLSLWTGYVPHLTRVGPHCVIVLLLSEALKEQVKGRKA